MSPDFNSLILFVRAAEYGSLTRAAASMPIALPAASRRIALLEHHFKIKLLTRTGRGVTLTSAGRLLVEEAKLLIEGLASLQGTMSAHADGRQDVIRLFANTSAITTLVPSVAATFRENHSAYQITIEERNSREVIEALQCGDADLGVFTSRGAHRGLKTWPLMCDELAAIVPPKHPIRGRTIHFRELLAYDLVTLESASDLSRLVISKAASLNLPLRLCVQCKSFNALCNMIRLGLGIGILPRAAVATMTRQYGLRSVRIAEPWAKRQLVVAVRQPEALRLAVQTLLEHLLLQSESIRGGRRGMS